MRLNEHPTVLKLKASPPAAAAAGPWSKSDLAELCRNLGADDVGFVPIDRPGIADQRRDILRALPGTKTLIAYVKRMNREPIRTPERSVSNLEFHHVGDEVNDTARRIVTELEARGARALNPSMGFPMEMDRFPGKIWVVSHKPVSVEAGLGRIGIHRNVIHPRFGNFVLLGTILLDRELDGYDEPIDYNPCLECKLCVAACPVGAIKKDGQFDFSACYTHNYREFMSGFTDWATKVAESRDQKSLRTKVTDPENASMWQSLSFGANYKAAYCLAVCPAGEEVISPFLADRKAFVAEVVEPLKIKEETVYVVDGGDAQAHVAKRFPHKTAKVVRSGLRPLTIHGFLKTMHATFQAGKAKELAARYHFTFTGGETAEATVVIDHGTLTVEDGHVGEADLHVTADARTWLNFLADEANIVWAIIRRRVKLKGPLRLLKAFGECFPR